MNYAISLLTYFDIFAFTPQLYFDDKPKLSNKLSKTFSLIFVGLFSYFVLVNFNSVINY